jgi:hypothetical protein
MVKKRLTIALKALVLVSFALTVPFPAFADGATQISGTGFFAGVGECTDSAGQDADLALRMTGDLEGCLYIFVETASCSPAGTYLETGRELFVAQENPSDSFMTTYKFTAKFQDCANVVGEIFGRCQHPIVAGSGKGIYEGVTGRLDFKDDIEAGDFPYRGHLRW